MARFFIDRPIFAWVVAIMIMVLGTLAITQLPVAQYPNVAPPSISVTASYAGASAETLQDTVTSVIEQQLNGIDNLLYMSSSSDAAGQATVTLFFQPGTDPDTAQVQVQNKVQLATPSLPQTVQQQGVVVAKATRNFMMFFTLSTEDGSMDEVALGNYIAASVLDPIRRVTGVGEAIMFGSQYAMRIWMNPDKLNSYGITSSDVIAAIQDQNRQVPVGQIGANPAVEGQQLNVIMQGRTTLRTTEEFENILLRMNPDGSRVLLKDVARVDLGAQDYGTKARVNGNPSAAVAIKLAPSANALTTAAAVREKVQELSKFFPPGVRVDYPLDTSTFVRISIKEVVKTLLEAVLLVFLVMYLFLQNFRATLIPTIVVPVAHKDAAVGCREQIEAAKSWIGKFKGIVIVTRVRFVSRVSSGIEVQFRPFSDITAAFSSRATDPRCPFQTLSRFLNSSVSFEPAGACRRKWKCPAARFGDDRS